MCYIQPSHNKHYKGKIIYHKEINRHIPQVIHSNIVQAGVIDMRTLHKNTPQKMSNRVKFFFSLQILLCSQCVVFPSHSLSLSLPKSARHSLGDKTRYSSSSPYFGILYCTVLCCAGVKSIPIFQSRQTTIKHVFLQGYL